MSLLVEVGLAGWMAAVMGLEDEHPEQAGDGDRGGAPKQAGALCFRAKEIDRP